MSSHGWQEVPEGQGRQIPQLSPRKGRLQREGGVWDGVEHLHA